MTTLPSREPVAIHVPLAVIATAVTGIGEEVSVVWRAPAEFQTLVVASSEPVTRRPEAAQDTAFTGPVCPLRGTKVPVVTSQMRPVSSEDTVARWTLSEDQARPFNRAA